MPVCDDDFMKKLKHFVACFWQWKMLKNKNQLGATYCFIILMIGSTCFGHCYAHHQELMTIVLITTWAIWFFKDGW